MLAGIHFLSSAALTSRLASNYQSAFLLGFALHHLEDLLPHLDLNVFSRSNLSSIKNWDLKIWLLILGEFSFFLFLTFYFLGNFNFPKQCLAVIGGFSALLPDIISLTINSFFPQVKIFNFYQNFHSNFHYRAKNKNYFLALLIEILLITLSIYLFTQF